MANVALSGNGGSVPEGLEATNDLLAMIHHRLSQLCLMIAETEDSDVKVRVKHEIEVQMRQLGVL